MSPIDADVLVIGAGLSGLRCAANLKQAGAAVHVIEARDRVGGRTYSVPMGRATFDKGGQWVGPSQKRVNALIDELGLERFGTHTEGKQILDVGGKTSVYQGTIPKMNPFLLIRLQLMIGRIERARKKVPAAEPWAMKGAEKLDATTVEAWRRKWVRNPKLLGIMDAAVRTIFGSEASELSLLHFLQYLNSGGGLMPLIEVEGGFQQDRIKGGAQQISEGLADQVGRGNLSLSAPIAAIEQDDKGVICRSGERMFTGRFCVITMPVALIDRIAFSPPMPVPRDQLTQRTHMGATVKCFALYPKAFWRDKGFSGEVVCGDGPITVVYDNTDADGRQPCLLAFVVGRFARSWSERPLEERRQQILGAFVRYFGPEAAQPTEYLEIDWSTEAYSGGCPISTFPPGTLSQFGSALRAPIGRLHWAGTETARECTGFMEGALESGDRAAQEVLGRL